MNRQGFVLSVVGAILMCTSVVLGGLSSGYGMGGIPILLRIGVGFVVLGIATSLWPPLFVRRGITNAILSAIIIFLVGISLLYYDLVLQSSKYGPTFRLLPAISTQFKLLLITLPIPAGYIAGVFLSVKQYSYAVFVFIATPVTAAIGGITISLAQGSAPGFTETFFLLSTFFVTLFALFPLAVIGWFDMTN